MVRSTVIDAPLARVWAVLRDFSSLDQWHTVVEQSRIEAGEKSDQVGCVRNFAPKDGHHIREHGLGEAARDENLASLARRGHRISLGNATGAWAAGAHARLEGRKTSGAVVLPA